MTDWRDASGHGHSVRISRHAFAFGHVQPVALGRVEVPLIGGFCLLDERIDLVRPGETIGVVLSRMLPFVTVRAVNLKTASGHGEPLCSE